MSGAVRQMHTVQTLPSRETAEVIAIGSQDLPSPLTPPGSYVGGEFMPVYHRDLRTSEVWRRAPHVARSVCLDFWMMLWEATPACSVPNDLGYIRKALGIADARTWKTVLPWIMQHLRECRDGRLYHQKQAVYANKILARRKQKNGSKDDVDPGEPRDIPGSTPGVPPGISGTTPNENNELDGKSARVGCLDKIDRRKEENLSFGKGDQGRPETAQEIIARGGDGGPLPEPGPQDGKLRLWREGRLIVQTFTGKNAAQARPLVGKWAADMADDYIALLHILRDVEAMNPVGNFEGAVVERIKVWQEKNGIAPRGQRGAGKAQGKSKQQELASSFEEEARRRMGLATGDDSFRGTVIDGEAS